MKTVAIGNDFQFPYHDPHAVDLFLDFLFKHSPDTVILNGDIMDAYAAGRFPRNPIGPQDLDIEIELAQQLMSDVRESGAKEMIWLDGNHEDRIRKLLWKNTEVIQKFGQKAAEDTAHALSMPNILEFEKFGFQYRPYMEEVQLGKLLVVHGTWARKHSGYSARAAFEKYGKSVLVAHSHRLGAHYVTQHEEQYGAWENGCLCELSPEWSRINNWQHGFSVVHVDEKTGWFNVQQIPILKRKLFFYGAETFTSAT